MREGVRDGWREGCVCVWCPTSFNNRTFRPSMELRIGRVYVDGGGTRRMESRSDERTSVTKGCTGALVARQISSLRGGSTFLGILSGYILTKARIYEVASHY